jgi:sec-independent protein translocase protein TatA
MFGFGVAEVVVVLVVALLIFGPRRLPEIGGALGKSIRDFRKSVTSKEDDDKPELGDGKGDGRG